METTRNLVADTLTRTTSGMRSQEADEKSCDGGEGGRRRQQRWHGDGVGKLYLAVPAILTLRFVRRYSTRSAKGWADELAVMAEEPDLVRCLRAHFDRRLEGSLYAPRWMVEDEADAEACDPPRRASPRT